MDILGNEVLMVVSIYPSSSAEEQEISNLLAGSSNLSLGAKCKPNLTRVSSRSAQAKCNTGNVNSSTGLQIYSVSLMDRTGGYGPSNEGSNPSPSAICQCTQEARERSAKSVTLVQIQPLTPFDRRFFIIVYFSRKKEVN